MTRNKVIFGTLTAIALVLAACSEPATPVNEAPAETIVSEAEAPAVEASEATETTRPLIEVTAAEIDDNPLLGNWDSAYGVPPFSEIEDAHYLPAIKQGIIELRAETDAIIANTDAPTFENTILALETAGSTLNQATLVYGNIIGTDTNDTLIALQGTIFPMLSVETDAIQFNPVLWERVQAVYAQRDSLDLDEQQARLLEITHRDFIRSGAAFAPEVTAQIADINAELSGLTSKFGENLLRSTKAFSIDITDPAQLAGLPDDFIAAIKDDEEEKWTLSLDRSVYETFMTHAENRDLREQMFNGYRLRASQGDFDNGPTLIRVAQLRAQRAELMGYPSHAHYVLETRMAKTPEEAEAFLLRVWEPGLERAREERADMQQMIGDEFTFAGHDWWFYSERVRQDRFAFDENQTKPYFELNAVRQGAFDVATRLFNVSFTPVEVEGWNPVVTSYDVADMETGEHLGLFMMDMYSRDSKRGGAWMSSYRSTSDINGERIRPIITNNLNLITPPEGQPTLMRYDEVETLFHEFGHGLHGLLTQIDYPSFSGVDGPRDYTEFPAQIMEHWAGAPQVLAEYATHYETGEIIPAQLIDRMRAAANHNQGFKTTEFIAASLLDLRWHMLSAEEAAQITDARAFEAEVLESYGILPEIEPRYRSNYFAHIFAGGYSAGYYAYLWSEILDADGFDGFLQSGDIFDPVLAARLKEWVFEAGGLREADELYRNFRGSDPSIEPLLRMRGLAATGQEG